MSSHKQMRKWNKNRGSRGHGMRGRGRLGANPIRVMTANSRSSLVQEINIK